MLDLRIQAFVEACRTASLACPSDCTTPRNTFSLVKAPLDPIDQQMALFNNISILGAERRILGRKTRSITTYLVPLPRLLLVQIMPLPRRLRLFRICTSPTSFISFFSLRSVAELATPGSRMILWRMLIFAQAIFQGLLMDILIIKRGFR